MKEMLIIIKGNFRNQKVSLFSIFLLVTTIAIFLSTIIALWTNTQSYEEQELNRMNYGDITAWVSNVPRDVPLLESLRGVEGVAKAEYQEILYSNYSIGETRADSQGQLLIYQPQRYDYKIFNNLLTGYNGLNTSLNPGEIYVSPALNALYGLNVGDTIHFSTLRQQEDKTFRVKGFFEDPFMGSTMVDMKSFLISENDYAEILNETQQNTANSLIEVGGMIHLFQESTSQQSMADFNQAITEDTQLNQYSRSVYTKPVISGFMLILQKIFSGLLLVFVVVLVIIILIVMSYCITSTIEQNRKNLGILKAQGFTNRKIKNTQLVQYVSTIILGMLLGILIAFWLIQPITQRLVTTSGILVPTTLPVRLILAVHVFLLLLFIGFIAIKLQRINRLSPIDAIQRTSEQEYSHLGYTLTSKGILELKLTFRQLLSNKKNYISVGLVAMLLVFFISLVVRMNSWLGPNGEGMMDAFNPADLDIGVERLGPIDEQEIEQRINQHTTIVDQYELAMPTVTIQGIDYTANVISETDRFHLVQGRAPVNKDEIVLTEFAAENLAVSIGDEVTITYQQNSHSFTVSGIYQCANEMGNNLGMSREGFSAFGNDGDLQWCTHYFLSDPLQSDHILNELNQEFGGDIHVHKNTWSGLEGILTAMKLLIRFMYVVVALFILIVVLLTGSKVLQAEQTDLAIFKTLGLTSLVLRRMFALRFTIVSLLGSAIGTLFTSLFTDAIVSNLLKLSGISNFSSTVSVTNSVFPLLIVVTLFTIFAYLLAAKVKRVSPILLMEEL